MTNIENLYDNEWLSLKAVREPEHGVSGYIFSHETRCQGRIVAVLPYRYTTKGVRFLVKSEITPCWAMKPVRSAVTGGYEGVSTREDAIRETAEETGYIITDEMLQPLGTCYASKSSDTVYDLYAVDVTGLPEGEAIGDGTRLESEAICEWITMFEAAEIQDAQFSVMVYRWMLRS